jgi:hypothetical protein
MALRPSESQCTCSNWSQRANDLFFPIWLNPETGEYVLLFGDRSAGALVIYYCPTCGRKMPRSRRGDLFNVPSNEELKEARLLLEKISDIASMRAVLGEPDDVFEWFKDETGKPIANPDGPAFVRQHKYLSQWKTLQVTIQENENGQLRFFFYGQQKRS